MGMAQAKKKCNVKKRHASSLLLFGWPLRPFTAYVDSLLFTALDELLMLEALIHARLASMAQMLTANWQIACNTY